MSRPQAYPKISFAPLADAETRRTDRDHQFSSGGKARLGRITKAGDAYLRTMLILGARAVLAAAKNKTDGLSRWAIALEQRRGYCKAVVAIAAKNARMCWAMLSRGEQFELAV